jgi:hypothetical protein
MSEQFQFQISKEKSLREAKLIPLIHKCMTDHFSKESSVGITTFSYVAEPS